MFLVSVPADVPFRAHVNAPFNVPFIVPSNVSFSCLGSMFRCNAPLNFLFEAHV